MGNFNRDNRRGGGRSFGGGGRDFNKGPRQMFKAKCDECGSFCELPFKPRGDKPVFCSDCFQEQGGPAPFKPERRDRQEIRTYKPDNTPNYKDALDGINDKLKQIIELLKEQNIPTPPAKEGKKEVKEEKPKKKETKKKKASPKTKKIVKKLKAKKATKKK